MPSHSVLISPLRHYLPYRTVYPLPIRFLHILFTTLLFWPFMTMTSFALFFFFFFLGFDLFENG